MQNRLRPHFTNRARALSGRGEPMKKRRGAGARVMLTRGAAMYSMYYLVRDLETWAAYLNCESLGESLLDRKPGPSPPSQKLLSCCILPSFLRLDSP